MRIKRYTFSPKLDRQRQHHNNHGLRTIKRGHLERQVKQLMKELGIKPMAQARQEPLQQRGDEETGNGDTQLD